MKYFNEMAKRIRTLTHCIASATGYIYIYIFSYQFLLFLCMKVFHRNNYSVLFVCFEIGK